VSLRPLRWLLLGLAHLPLAVLYVFAEGIFAGSRGALPLALSSPKTCEILFREKNAA
jgi:hypothetical protein